MSISLGQRPFLIAPSLLAADLANLEAEVRAVEQAGADVLHFDIMDGHFVPNITMGFPVLKAMRKHTKLPFDAHLMISHADRYLEEFAEVGCNWLSVHVEACPHLNRTLTRIRELGMQAGVAINPGTSLATLDAVLDTVDYVLIMSVNPGFGGQKFIPSALDRVRELKRRLGKHPARIQIDGGIKEDNLAEVVRAGAEILVIGTGIFAVGRHDYGRILGQLRSAGQGAKP